MVLMVFLTKAFRRDGDTSGFNNRQPIKYGDVILPLLEKVFDIIGELGVERFTGYMIYAFTRVACSDRVQKA